MRFQSMAETRSDFLEEEVKVEEKKSQNSTTVSIMQTLSPEAIALTDNQGEYAVPGRLVGITLDYALLPEKKEKDQLTASYCKILPEANIHYVNTIHACIRQKCLGDLHRAILSGDLKTLEEQIKQDPKLLLEKLEEKECMTIQGLSGHKASVTLYRTALATEDTQMAEMIKAKLIEVAGKEEADAQYNAQFPKGWELLEEKRWKPMSKQLDVVTQAIRYAKPDDIVSSGYPEYKLTVKDRSNVAIALAHLRSLLDATLNEIVTIGRHFNPHFLLKEFQLYDDYFGNNLSDPRALAFWRLVIGYAQRFMPVNYVQAFFDGLYNSEEKLRKGIPQGRSLKFKVFDSRSNTWVSTDFYPLSISRLGFDFAFGWAGVASGEWPRVCRGAGAKFSKLMSIKNSKLTELTELTVHPDHNHRSTTMSCSVM